MHPDTVFYLEFPPGPLSIGDDLAIVPVELPIGDSAALGLSATDSCRDRLAAFYHWKDRQALALAVELAAKQTVDVKRIESWSEAEGKSDAFHEFRRLVTRRRRG